MGLLEQATVKMTNEVTVGTNGLKLVGLVNEMVKNIDDIIDVFENMTPSYANNMLNTLGEAGFQQAQEIYTAIKTLREQLKTKGI